MRRLRERFYRAVAWWLIHRIQRTDLGLAVGFTLLERCGFSIPPYDREDQWLIQRHRKAQEQFQRELVDQDIAMTRIRRHNAEVDRLRQLKKERRERRKR